MRVAFVVYPTSPPLISLRSPPHPEAKGLAAMRTLLRLLPLLVVLGVVAPPAAAEVECQAMDGSQIPDCDHITVR